MTEHVQSSALSWRSRARRTVNVLLETIFPPVCANCNKVGALLCERCEAKIRLITKPICARCGDIIKQRGADICCGDGGAVPLTAVRAAAYFADPLSTLIHRLKYEGQFALAEPLAQLMASAWGDWAHAQADVVLPVPLHPERQRERGYNQAALLAQDVCRQLQLPYEEEALLRVRHTTPQVGLSAGARQENVLQAFWAQADGVRGKRVLLIDDVYTTGATMSAAAEALLTMGAASVSAFCLARTL